MITAECQETRELLDSYLSAELLVETNHQILRHAAACAGCRAELARRQRLRQLMKAVLPAEDPPADLLRRIAAISGPATAASGAAAASSRRPFWRRLLRREPGFLHHRRDQTQTRTLARQVLAVGLVGAAILVLVGIGQWSPWTPARLTAAELLDLSDKAVGDLARQSDVVLHRSLTLEERRGPARRVVARRRVEVWKNGATGTVFKRAYDDQNALVAGESLAADGARTVYRAGSPPQDRAQPLMHGRLSGLGARDDNAAWRLDLSATEYSSLLPAGASAQVEAAAEHYVLKYEGPVRNGRDLVEATLKLRRDTLLPVEEKLIIGDGADRREYSVSETRLQTLPRREVPAVVFEPDAILTGPVERLPAPRTAANTPPAPPVASEPSLDTELDVVYRLHQAEAWRRDAVSVRRMADRTLEVSAIVVSHQRRGQLLAALAPAAAPGVHIDVKVEPHDPLLPRRSPEPPPDLRAMPTYAHLRAEFAAFIHSRMPQEKRPSPEEEERLVDGLVRSLAARTLDRAHVAMTRALVLQHTARQFSLRSPAELSPDAEATLQTMLRDHARGIAGRLEALRLELEPMFAQRGSAGTPGMLEPRPAPDLFHLSQQLAGALSAINADVQWLFGRRAEARPSANPGEPELWRRIAEAERLAAIFEEPLPLGRR